MFKRLQMKMTLTYTLILIGVLMATNVSIYFLMSNYNNYQMATEVQNMLGRIEGSEWLYEQDQTVSGTEISNDGVDESGDDSKSEDNKSDTVDDETLDNAVVDASGLVSLPTATELIIPQTVKGFQYYMIFDDEGQLVQQKSDNRGVFDRLLLESLKLSTLGVPKVVSLNGDKELHFLLVKMPIVIQNQTLGYYAVARDVTVAFETMDNLVKILLISFVVGVLASAGLGYFLAGRGLKPVKAAYHSKQTFLADASHELKTPLSVIMLSTETLASEIQPHEDFQLQIVADIKEEAVKMNELVTHLLFLARSDSASQLLKPEILNFSELLSDEVYRFQKMAQTKNIFLSENIAAGIKHSGDRKLIQSVFSILLDNAIKYTKEGGSVWVELERQDSKGHQGIQLRVVDTGIGIPESELQHIFERFYRLESSRSKETGGYGLGLAIAKDIIEQHSGRIYARSVVGQGTEFVVIFK